MASGASLELAQFLNGLPWAPTVALGAECGCSPLLCLSPWKHPLPPKQPCFCLLSLFESPRLLLGCSVVSNSSTPWTAALQAFFLHHLRSALKLLSIESVMPSDHLILCCPLVLLTSVFPSIRVFSSESALRISWPSTGPSASVSVLPVNTQG